MTDIAMPNGLGSFVLIATISLPIPWGPKYPLALPLTKSPVNSYFNKPHLNPGLGYPFDFITA